jgi:hypothetical protein
MVRTNKNVSRKRKNKITKIYKKYKIKNKKIYRGGAANPLIANTKLNELNIKYPKDSQITILNSTNVNLKNIKTNNYNSKKKAFIATVLDTKIEDGISKIHIRFKNRENNRNAGTEYWVNENELTLSPLIKKTNKNKTKKFSYCYQ